MSFDFRQKKSLRFALISIMLTVVALGAALISAVAGQIGEYELQSLGSKAALGLALIIIIYVVPRLARGVRIEYLHSEYSIHIPNAGLIFCALILVVTILALSSGNNLLYLVLSVLLATMIVSWLASRLSLGRMSVSARFPDQIFAGEAASFEIVINNRKIALPAFSLAVAMLEKRASSAAQEMAEMAYFPVIPPRSHARLRTDHVFSNRGVYPIRGFVLGTRFPFGFVEQRRLIESPEEIVVFPQPQPIAEFDQLLPLTQGRVESQVKGSGSDLYAIRQYLASDHHHHIDWKATAKTTRLMVREFTRDDDLRVTIAFAPQVDRETAASPEFDRRFERAVVFAASLIKYFIDQGAEVRLLIDGDDSGYGMDQRHLFALLRRLAMVAPVTGPDDADGRPSPAFGAPAISSDQCVVLITSVAGLSPAREISPATHVIKFEEL